MMILVCLFVMCGIERKEVKKKGRKGREERKRNGGINYVLHKVNFFVIMTVKKRERKEGREGKGREEIVFYLKNEEKERIWIYECVKNIYI